MRDNRINKLQRQVKTLQKELRRTHKTVKGVRQDFQGGAAGGGERGVSEKNTPTVGSVMKTLIFGTGEEGPAFDPASIPRDHIMDPKQFRREAVMKTSGRGEDILPPADEMFDVDLMFAAQVKQMEEGKTAHRPPFITDACYDVEDGAGLERWRKTHQKHQKELKNKPLHQQEEPEPVSVLAVQGGEAPALLRCLAEEENCYGAVGYPPRNYGLPLARVDEELTAILNESDRIVAVGPVGLDMVRLGQRTMAAQQALLVQQLDVAVDFAVPVIFRQRGAGESLRRTIDAFERCEELIGIWASPLTAMTGLEWLRRHDFYLAVTPELTHVAQEPYRQFVSQMPEDRLLLMTGDLVTPPENQHGHWNTPWLWRETFDALAGCLGKQEVAEKHALMHQLNANFIRAFFGEEEDEV